MAGYLTYDGTVGNFATSPHIAAYDVAGDLDITVECAMDWATFELSHPCLISHNNSGVGDQGWFLVFRNNGFFRFYYSLDGGTTQLSLFSSVAVSGFDDGEFVTVRVVRTSADGVIKFYMNGTQLGTDVAGTAGVLDSGANLPIIFGAYRPAGGEYFIGSGRSAVVKAGVDGTIVYDAKFSSLTPAEVAAASFTESSSNAATVTLAGSSWEYSRTVGVGGFDGLAAPGQLLVTGG